MTLDRRFTSDNAAGIAPEVLAALAGAAVGQAPPYGTDPLTGAVTEQLREVFEHDLAVHVVSSGSAANGLALATVTPPWGSVLCHRDSHVDNDESGAPEFFTGGAKLVTVDGDGTRIAPDALEAALRGRSGDLHTAPPSALSLTQATESGSVYTLDEIATLTATAHDAGLATHMDGARFAPALVALGATPADMTWRAGIDALSFGATKNGTATAEAVVLFDTSRGRELAHRGKRAGQLVAKMRFQSAQLSAYLHDGVWLRNARHANAMADRLASGLAALPDVAVDAGSPTNIRFCRLPAPVIDGLLAEGFAFYHDRWEPGIVRFVTSFATSGADVDDLVAAVTRLGAVLTPQG